MMKLIETDGGTRKWRRRIMVVLAASCLTIGGLLAASPPASAVPCSGASCDGLDPKTTGCNELKGRTLRSVTHEDWDISYQLRRSDGCKAVWTRFVRDDCEQAAYNPPTYHWVRVQTQIWTPYTGWTAYKTHTDGMQNETDPCDDSTGWTVMAPGHSGTRARACWAARVWPNDTKPPSSAFECTGWVEGA